MNRACGPRITRLTLANFRSFAALDVSFQGKSVILTGPNGTGKTNMLEALSLLGAGRGLRHAKRTELLRQQADTGEWQVALTLSDVDKMQTRLGITGDRHKRRVRIDGEFVKPQSLLLDHIRFLWLTPAQDRLFMEGASERRRFLDRLVLAHDPLHARQVSAFETSTRQRQKLLESFPQCDHTLLGILERQMAESGTAIAAARRLMVERLGPQISGASESLILGAFPAAEISLDGYLEQALGAVRAADLEDEYAARLKDNRALDAQAGRALIGPHRCDLLVRHKEKDQAARLCSTGEQKALLIGLLLANGAILMRDLVQAPLILLLDEVAAHLDQHRRRALFDMIEAIGCQAFMTGTDGLSFVDYGDRAEHFLMAENGLELTPSGVSI